MLSHGKEDVNSESSSGGGNEEITKRYMKLEGTMTTF